MHVKIHSALERLVTEIQKSANADPGLIRLSAETLRDELMVFRKEHKSGGKISRLCVSMLDSCQRIIDTASMRKLPPLHIFLNQVKNHTKAIIRDFKIGSSELAYESGEWNL